MEPMKVDNGMVQHSQRIIYWGETAFVESNRVDGVGLKVGTPTNVTVFEGRLSQAPVVDIACRKQHSVFLLADGQVYSASSNESKQLGRERKEFKPEMLQILETKVIKFVASGDAFTLVLDDENILYSFGANEKGQLGYRNDIAKDHERPRIIKDLKPNKLAKIVQVSCGACHCLALSSNGSVYSWGDNENGQLGYSLDHIFSKVPREIPGLSFLPIYMVAAGGSHSFALTMSGTLFAWGKNRFGQLGLGDNRDRTIPEEVKSLHFMFITHICCGEEHTVVLTKLGRVFTFGYGGKGQLGHSKTDDLFSPTQVMELSGDQVSQIACGRWHTLAFVESTGKVYSFGLNNFGQLGNGEIGSQADTPTVVHGDWAGFSVHKLFAGGNQSFVILEQGCGISPANHRQRSMIGRSTLFLDEEKIKQLVAACSGNGDEEMRRHALDVIEAIFTSPSCLNCSFLNPETHEKTDLKNSGLDTTSTGDEGTDFLLRKSIFRLEKVPSIRERVGQCALKMLKTIPRLPPNLEACRVLLLIPEIACLVPEQLQNTFVVEFGRLILEMDERAVRILCFWWTGIPASMFSNIVSVFKKCIKDAMPSSSLHISQENWRSIIDSLLVLRLLNKVNDESNLIPYEAFYIQSIQEKINLAEDYCNFKSKQSKFCFCQFPFIFDVKAKAEIMEIDANIKMRIAIGNILFSNVSIPFLVLHVRRGAFLVSDTISQIERAQTCQDLPKEMARMTLKKPLKVVFEGEAGVDLGGLKKEFFLLLMEELFDEKYRMFEEIESSQTVWFDKRTFEEPKMYYIIGVICGLALYNSVIIDLHFPLVLYKKLLRQETDFSDFESFDPIRASSLTYLLNYDEAEEGEVENVFGLVFAVDEMVFGEIKTTELIEDGANKPVNGRNKQDFVNRFVDYYLNKSIAEQYEAFSKGFYQVCEEDILSLLRPNELKEMISGVEDYEDFMALKENADYCLEYHENHPVIVHFWEVLREFDLPLKKKFLEFLTGSYKIPIKGLKTVKIQIRPMNAGQDDELLLPVAHTCFNALVLPKYRKKAVMKERITYAVSNFSKGFGLE